jgi:penicillin-binding protein 1A
MKKETKKSQTGSVRRPAHRKGAHSVYSNLATKKRTTADAKSRKKAEFLATLPKSRIKRLFYRLHPRRFFKYWFSKQGAIMALKISGLGLAAGVIFILAIFAIFRKDLAIGPDELTKRIQSRTTKFYDRTGQVLLYELYKDQQLTFVKPDQISNNMKWATVAIEDKDFYKHGGFDMRGIIRSVVNNASGGGKQGASTLTQQLARNVILEDNTRSGIAGYTRKLKEIILSIELERTYSKDEILNFYLNSIGYGGTAYGVESAAQRYFGISAKDLNIEQAAYIAAIPQFPSLYDKNSPSFDPEATEARVKTVISYMQQQGYIKSDQAKAAKEADVLTAIKPLSDEPTTKKAPHFIDELVKQLESKYGAKNVRKNGWRVITTIDWDMQQLAEKAVRENIKDTERYGGDDAALVAVEVGTNQVLSLVGSRDYSYPGFGNSNAASSDLQPGSSLKPFVYGTLFETGQYGAGSVIPDTPKCWYGICPKNANGQFFGNISIRQSLGGSRNLPAMKAADIAKMSQVIERAKIAGETDITCGQENECNDPFLAIGKGTVRLDEHTSAYASLANNGIAKPKTIILKIEKPNGDIVEEWKDTAGTPVFGTAEKSSEISYMLSDIMSDQSARQRVFGSRLPGFITPGVKTAVKTGTTDNNKDSWVMGYSSKLAVGVWTGNHNGKALSNSALTNLTTGPMFNQFMGDANKQVMSKPQYGWNNSIWFKQPPALKKMTVGGFNDFFPSWYKKPKEESQDVVFDKVSKKLATECTPVGARETIKITVISDPTKPTDKIQSGVPEGYNILENDDVHQCGAEAATGFSLSISAGPSRGRTITTTFTPSSPVQSVEFIVNGQVVNSQGSNGGSSYSTTYTFPDVGSYTIQARVTDSLYYQSTSASQTVMISS